MKKTIIENLHKPQIEELSIDLFGFIEMTYGITEANDRFLDYFVNHLVKYYKHMTFSEIESAFEHNSCGLLDLYLPKVGQRPDNKVLKFNIPDLTKVINAYCKFSGIQKSEQQSEKKVFSQKEKHNIRQEWCDQLCNHFDRYYTERIAEAIRTPLYTAKLLAELGILSYDKIDFNEPSTNIMHTSTRTNNERLIYDSFDAVIDTGIHLSDIILEFRQEFSEGIPF